MNENYDQAGLLNGAANLQDYGLSERQILAAQAQAAATLALVYEQRTANLIAVCAVGGPPIGLPDRNIEDAYLPAIRQIEERLGLA